ncbi:MAG TPA: AAA family ATPase [Solirubrobacteraceae bacterium]|jgi:DNA-binding CsgD family transcriptional regulator
MEGKRRPDPDASLLERDDQLAVIAEAANAVSRGETRAIAIVAEAGLGKSSLIAATADAAAAAGLHTLRARGAELERDFPFGVVLQLLGGRAAALERDGLFTGSAALARPLLLGERSPTDVAAGDPAAMLHGLFWLVSELAERGPLALLVDDLHWADELSVRFVLHLFERSRDLPGLLAVAARPAEPGAPRELVARVVGHEAATELQPRALSEEAVAAVVARAGFPGGDRNEAFVAACRDVTGGNPLLLRELLRALLAEGAGADAAGVARVREIGPHPVSRAVMLSLGRLDPAAAALARALAVLGDGASLHTAAALAEVDVETAARAAASLELAGIFRREAGLGFVHPIVRSAVYADLPPSERALAHRLAARVLAPDAPVERVAAHLLVATPATDAWAAQTLERAAAAALESGAPTVAAAHLRRAVEEPPAAEDRPRILGALGRALAAAGEPEAADVLEQAVEAAPPGRERALLLLELGRLHTAANALRPGAAAFDRGAAELNGDDEELRLELDAAWVMATLFDPAVGVSAMARIEPLLAPGARPRTPGQRKVLAHIASAETLRIGDRLQGVELARRAWGAGALLADAGAEDAVLGGVTAALSFAEHYEEAVEVADAMVEDARIRGSALGFVSASYLRGALFLLWGKVPDAIADLEVAVDGRRSNWEQYRARAIGQLAEAVFEGGDEERALTLLRDSEAEPGYGEGLMWAAHLDHRGNVALARGEHQEALDCYAQARAGMAAVMPPINPAFSPCRRGMAVALTRLGRPDEGRALAEEDLELARRWGAPATIGAALLARGLTAGRDGIDDLREAVAIVTQTDVGLPAARARFALGVALRAAGRRTEARDALRGALDAAEGCGARRIAALAREELVALGARPRRARLSGVESLTPSERRVARMAAEGMTNREIAEALFVTRKAIQWHLGNAYRKLRIQSREELPDALAE